MLTIVSIPANAIERYGDTEVSELRQKIGLDYSMPDYSVNIPITFIDGISGSNAANRLFMIINSLYKDT